MKKVNFSDMVAAVATRTGKTKATVKEILEANSDMTRELVKDGNEVVLHKIGKFYPKEREARTSRNPKTGEVVQVPAKTGFKFKPNNDVKKPRGLAIWDISFFSYCIFSRLFSGLGVCFLPSLYT